MQLITEQSIHHAPPVPSAPLDWEPRFRKVTRSPIEELRERIHKYGAMEAIPDALAALMLQTQRWETVAPNGIEFKINGVSYRYFHPESHTCVSSVGERVLFSYDPDDLEVIYILTADGRFKEAIPRDQKVVWFDADMEKQIAKYRSTTQHVYDSLKRTHAATTEKEHDRAKANAEALQFHNQFPLPEDVQEKKDEEPAESYSRGGRIKGLSLLGQRSTRRGMEHAEGLVAAQKQIRKMREDHVEREEELSRVRISSDEFAAATHAEASGEEYVFSPDEISAALSSEEE